MKIVLALLIPAIWFWAVALGVAIRDFFGDPIYQEFSTFVIGAMIFPSTIAIACTYILVNLIRQLRNS